MAGLETTTEKVNFPHTLPIVEIRANGEGHWLASDRLVHTTIGAGLCYESHNVESGKDLDRLSIYQTDESRGLKVATVYEIPTSVPMFRTYVRVENTSTKNPLSLESVTSLVSPFGATQGEASDSRAWDLLEESNDWLGEGRWERIATADLFPVLQQQMTGHTPRGEHSVVSTGTWSTGKHSPLAVLESSRFHLAWVFQIEHNGAWRWEVGDDTDDGYLALSGPTNTDHSWSKILAPGQFFTTVSASAGVAEDFAHVMELVTRYRRAVRTQHSDNAIPRILFNDYMNTLNGDPTTEKLLPLIKEAAGVGVEAFCIDCGWYDDTGDWWPSVGEWMPSKKRFPGGITEVIDAIKDAGMVPGLWIEPEVVGESSPVVDKLPETAFFHRNGFRVREQQRYVLDFRDAAAREHLNSVIDRLVKDYGIGYFKFDYNVSPGSGTDMNADSVGDGMLENSRAYSEWVDGLHRRYPDLILENCSSGGMRMDFAQTSRFQVQSTSDQQDFKLYPTIAAAAPVMMLPEQAANWAYPQSTMSLEEGAFNLNTTMLGRFFLSGYVNRMSDEQRKLISEAIAVYKKEVQPVVSHSVPFWPLGLPGWNDSVVALGLKAAEYSLVTVWARDASNTESTIKLSLPHYCGKEVDAHAIFPTGADFDTWPLAWDSREAMLEVKTPEHTYASRTFIIVPQQG
jgi:alpha-galactosidase